MNFYNLIISFYGLWSIKGLQANLTVFFKYIYTFQASKDVPIKEKDSLEIQMIFYSHKIFNLQTLKSVSKVVEDDAMKEKVVIIGLMLPIKMTILLNEKHVTCIVI